MSRFEDHRVHSDPSEALERDKAGPNRTVDIGSRFGMSKEAARKEMDRFRGVAEYETRKIFGQRSSLKQAVPSPQIDDSALPSKKSVERASDSVVSIESENPIEILERAANE